jgi:NAD(P)-dependent dehydrogenase (short-subunit alcohol dehydrogenase family)
MNSFEGKVVLITGAGRGMGRALAEHFAALGARVAANDISPVNLDQVVERGRGRITAYVEDTAKKVAAQAIIKQVEDDLGRIDILINHASVEPRVALLEMDEWDWHRVLDVNLTGAFLMMQSAGRVMRAQGAGVIVNLINAAPPAAGSEAAYLTSLHALAVLTRCAAEEFAAYRVHVHAVGTGISEYHNASPSIPEGFMEAALFLCDSPLYGQIVNVEAP